MQFNTNIQPKHFERNFIEIRKTSQTYKIGILYNFVEVLYKKDVPFKNLDTLFITNAELIDKQTITSNHLTNSISNICFGCNKEIGKEILKLYGIDQGTRFDVLTFKNVSIC